MRFDVRRHMPPYVSHNRDMCYALPCELQYMILGFVGFGDAMRGAARVNTGWYRNVRDMDCWRQVSLLTKKRLSAQNMQTIVPCWRWLEVLDMSGCRLLTDDAVEVVLSSCPALSTLAFSKCAGIGDEALRWVGLSGHRVTHVDVSFCEKVTDMGVAYIAEGLGHRLQSLNVGRCQQLTDTALYLLARHCPKINTLNLTFCQKVSDKGLLALSKKCPRLTRLSLRWCAPITDQGVRALAKGLRGLESLTLDHCRLLTDQCVYELSRHCTLLHHLSLVFCDLLTDAAVLHLQRGRCTRLAHLSLSYCDKISKPALAKLLVYAPLLPASSLPMSPLPIQKNTHTGAGQPRPKSSSYARRSRPSSALAGGPVASSLARPGSAAAPFARPGSAHFGAAQGARRVSVEMLQQRHPAALHDEYGGGGGVPEADDASSSDFNSDVEYDEDDAFTTTPTRKGRGYGHPSGGLGSPHIVPEGPLDALAAWTQIGVHADGGRVWQVKAFAPEAEEAEWAGCPFELHTLLAKSCPHMSRDRARHTDIEAECNNDGKDRHCK
jgi:hypothetical protein